jgi:hypothetical protein
LKFYFKYEGSVANVYQRSEVYGDSFVASFKFGIDAKEYVNWKNEIQASGTV